MAGMRDINRMTVPLGYRNGGETQVAMSDPDPMAELEDMYNNMIKDGTYKGTWEDFLLDIKEAAKGGMVGYALGGPAGMMNINRMTRPVRMEGGGLLGSVGNLDIKVKKLELMDLTGSKGLSLAEIDELDNMSASQIDKLYKEKFGK